MPILNDKRKYLLVVAIIILVGFGLFFSYAFRAHEQVLIRQMAYEKQQDVELLGGLVDKFVETTGSRSPEFLIFIIEFIEQNYHSTFAQLFDEDLNPMVEQSPGVGGGKKHNPLNYPEFIEAVTNNEHGNLVYTYETPQAGLREVYMTFRWVPSDIELSSRHLIAVGISKYTISAQLDTMVMYGAVTLTVIAGVFILGSAILIVKLGYIYDQRTGEKWRKRGVEDARCR